MTSFLLEIYWEDAILLQPSSVNEWNKVIPNEINTYIKASPPGEVTEVLQHHWSFLSLPAPVCTVACCASARLYRMQTLFWSWLDELLNCTQNQTTAKLCPANWQNQNELAVGARVCPGCKHFFGVTLVLDLHTKDLKVSGFPHQCLHSRRSFFSLNWNAGRVSNAIGYGFGFLTAGSGRTDHAIRKATPSLELSSWFFYPFKAFHEYLSNEH